MIKPSTGRVVHFTPGAGFCGTFHGDQPLAAIIAHVWHDRMVNLTVLDSNGSSLSVTSVPLLQDDDPQPPEGFFAAWMPYQKGQAAKTEALERALTKEAT